ncbi:hypothetical protein V1477_000501 [Vespula maculifrons]|uniref:Uncharacterized protein n=1 Tax=Vespula maculifrons TaxID=7453 RepID=A0ABD2D1T1_VESMC
MRCSYGRNSSQHITGRYAGALRLYSVGLIRCFLDVMEREERPTQEGAPPLVLAMSYLVLEPAEIGLARGQVVPLHFSSTFSIQVASSFILPRYSIVRLPRILIFAGRQAFYVYACGTWKRSVLSRGSKEDFKDQGSLKQILLDFKVRDINT